ncbi:MAG: hypothetical protein IEMM0002_0986 [bacterium]|nr:MAG: hypothetical protein IEMM0002_0986 [bacterium]
MKTQSRPHSSRLAAGSFKKYTLLPLVSVLIGAFGSLAEPAGLTMFKNMTTYATSKDFRIAFAFDGKPKESVRFFKESIQIDFADTQAAPPKKVYEINRAGISALSIYQIDPQTVRILIKPADDMERLRKNFSLHKRGDKLIVKIYTYPGLAKETGPVSKTRKTAAVKAERRVSPHDAPKMNSLTKKRPASPARKKAIEELTTSLSGFGRQSPAAASGDKPDDGAAGISVEKGFLDYSEPEAPVLPSFGEAAMKVGGSLAIVLAVVLLIAFGAKRYLSATGSGVGKKRQVKVLSNHYIGVKKSVTLVEIGGEILALGVTNDNISLLARYDNPEKIEKIMLNHRLPDPPAGIFKKLPFIPWVGVKKKPASSDFSKEVENYAQSLEENDSQKKEATKEEMVSNAQSVIASRLRAMESGTGKAE